MNGGERLNISQKLAIIALVGFLASATFVTTACAQEFPWEETAGAEAAFLGLSGICCFLVFLPWIIWIILAIWVYKDAEKRGKSGVLWFIIVFFLGIIGLIVWLVVRPPIGGEKATSDRKCPNCGRPIPMDARACPYCAKKFEE